MEHLSESAALVRESPDTMHRVAVVGGGIAGLGAAWLIGQRHHVTLFEAGDYFGGHSNTVDVTLEGRTAPVDTGFLVHNTLTYPLLVKMFEHLGVPTRDTDMSFAVSLERPELEWAGTNLATVFARSAAICFVRLSCACCATFCGSTGWRRTTWPRPAARR